MNRIRTVAIAMVTIIALIIAVAWIAPEKAAEMAVPISIIVCGLAGPWLAGTWLGAAAMGGLLGLIDAIVMISLARLLDLPDKLSVGVRLTASIGFAIGPALGTFLWVQFQRRNK